MSNAFGNPVLVVNKSSATTLNRVQLGSNFYDEKWLQELLFHNPECLPIQEIDRSFTNLIPICMELNTGAGPIDALYVTPEGKLVIAEAKLWRNPEARRKVIGQVLDYAKELSTWRYEDLQREVSKRLKRSGNALFDVVAERCRDVDEALFVDEVNRTLEQGEFLLLLIGDGIRSDAAAIADYIEGSGTLNFTFGMVEAAIYKLEDGSHIVQPRVLAKTVVIERTVVTLVNDRIVAAEPDVETGSDDTIDPKLEERRQFWLDVWGRFIDSFSLDDPAQRTANLTRGPSIFWMMGGGGSAWVTTYIAAASNNIGVMMSFANGSWTDGAYEFLAAQREEIEAELNEFDVSFDWNRSRSERNKLAFKSIDIDGDAGDARVQQTIFEQLGPLTNAFVNTFSHRLRSYADEVSKS